MHCVSLADLAAILSQHAPSIRCRGPLFPPQSLVGYWASSRARLDLWQRSIGRYRRAQQAGNWIALRQWWDQNTAILEEVLVSEILTRVVAAAAAEIDRVNGTDEVAPVTHAIQIAHLEARTRVQQVMIDGRGCSVPDAVRLNRLRQGVERWTDVMIGRMSPGGETLARYAMERERAEAYAEEARGCGHGATRETAIWLMNAAMHDMLSRRTAPVAALPKANRRVADSALRMLQRPLFDSLGTVKSIRLRRIENDLLGSDRAVVHPILVEDAETIPIRESEKTTDAHRERWYL